MKSRILRESQTPSAAATTTHPAFAGIVSCTVAIKHPGRILQLPPEAVEAGLTARLCTLSVPPASTAVTT